MTINNDAIALPDVGSRWQHRSGQFYIVLHITNTAATNTNYPIAVVYRNEDTGATYSRNVADWARSMTFAPKNVVPPAERRLQAMRRACGYVENGTHDTVCIFQDDATRDWIVYIGPPMKPTQRFWDDSFDGVVDKLADWLDANPFD